MIRVKADPKNKRVFFGIDNLTRRHKKAIRHGAYDIGRQIKRDGMRRINNVGRTGRFYTIGQRVHRASAPGQPPANITGRLMQSVDYDVRGYRQVEFGYTALYGEFLEEGTSLLERRPNLRPIADDNTQRFINYMVRYYREDR